MEIPNYEPFYLETLAELRAEIERLGLDIPVAEKLEGLGESLQVGDREVSNRFCSQPISGNDAAEGGAAGEMTTRRNTRYAAGGFGLIWIESTAATLPGRPGQLVIKEANLEPFRTLVESIRKAAIERRNRDVVLVLQLAVPFAGATQRFPGMPEELPLITDGEIEACRDHLAGAASLAAEAGFDGVDIQSCRGALAGRLLSAFEREGGFGGSFESRSRFLRESVEAIRSDHPDLLIATRLNAYDAVRFPHGFGVDRSDYRKEDLSEPIRLVRELKAAGLELLNVNAASPNLHGASEDRSTRSIPDGEIPHEHPLMVLARQLRIAGALREAAPGLPVVASGFSWLRSFAPHVAAGAIADGTIDFAGFGRGALAYPDAPADVLEQGGMRPERSCMVCFACSTLRDEKKPVGCPIRDPEVYGEAHQPRRVDPDDLEEEARRCHFCEAAPCVSAGPTHTDIPGFIRAYLSGDESKAFEIIRAGDVLPEMTSHLSPGWLQSEGACIETALTGFPVPILDLQHAISWRARDRGETKVRLPARKTGKKIAIVGGGPAGLAASIRLLEYGHEVDLFEQADQLGGTPQRVIPSSRVPELLPEINAIPGAAKSNGWLRLHLGRTLGEDLALNNLRSESDAVLLAVGVWRECSIGKAGGVIPALSFLESVKRGEIEAVPDRVAVLTGGDSAMDAAVCVQKLGTREIFIVFGGARSEMHWHMPEDWFETPGVETRFQCEPLGYETNETETLTGLRFRNRESNAEEILRVGMVIEAMGLEVTGSVRAALSELSQDEAGRIETTEGCRTGLDRVYAAGGLVNGGASVGQCVAEGMKAAEVIHSDLV